MTFYECVNQAGLDVTDIGGEYRSDNLDDSEKVVEYVVFPIVTGRSWLGYPPGQCEVMHLALDPDERIFLLNAAHAATTRVWEVVVNADMHPAPSADATRNSSSCLL